MAAGLTNADRDSGNAEGKGILVEGTGRSGPDLCGEDDAVPSESESSSLIAYAAKACSSSLSGNVDVVVVVVAVVP